MTAIIEHGTEKEARSKKSPFTEDAWKTIPPIVSTGRTLSLLPVKWRDNSHGPFGNYVSETVPARYEMQRYPTKVDGSADSYRNSRLLPPFPEGALYFRKSTLALLLRFAFFNEKL